jgi:hypothetical protein
MTHTPGAMGTAGRAVLARVPAIWNAVVAGGMALLVAGGCGLVSSDVTKVSFDLPARSYRFDTAQAGWKTSTATSFATIPSIACAADTDCCPPAVMALGIDCSLIVCDGTSSTCAFTVTVEAPPQKIDLKQSVPPSLSSQSVIDITVSQITYDVTENSMNVDLPPVQLFIANDSATSTDDPSAVLFGTVPATPKGTTSTGRKVTLEQGAADAAFINIGHHLDTPFTFLARSRVVVPGGTPIPMGALGLTIKGRLAAQPGL